MDPNSDLFAAPATAVRTMSSREIADLTGNHSHGLFPAFTEGAIGDTVVQVMSAIATAEQAPSAALTGFELMPREIRGRVIYLIEAPDGRTKVGISKKPAQRIATVIRSSGIRPVAMVISPALKNASVIESLFKAQHRGRCVDGEWFAVSLADARAFVETHPWVFDDAASAAEHHADHLNCEKRSAVFFDKLFDTNFFSTRQGAV